MKIHCKYKHKYTQSFVVANLVLFNIINGQDLRSCLESRASTAELIARGTDRYVNVNYQWNVRKLLNPRGYVIVRSVGDVQSVINCARALNLSITAKSGGHSLEKYSYGSDRHWVVDLANLNSVRFNYARNTVTVGSGIHLKQLTDLLWSMGRFALPVGTCPSVGISGFTLGGGFGLSSRKFGLMIDRMVEIEIVTADGRVRRASRAQNFDLFWALRGSGGGLFGIVTKFSFRVFKASNRLITVSKRFSSSQFISAFNRWQRWVASDPSESITSIFQLPANTRSPEIIFVINNLNFARSVNCLNGLGRLFPEINERDVSVVRYIQMTRATSAPFYSARTARVYQKATNFYVSRVMAGSELQRFAAALRNNSNVQLLIEQYGGVIKRISRSSSVFAHRSHLYVLQYGFTDVINGNRSLNESIAIGQSKLSELRRFTQQIRFLDTGYSYVNYPDEEFSDWRSRYFSTNFQRLQRVKSVWDRNDFFKYPPLTAPPRV